MSRSRRARVLHETHAAFGLRGRDPGGVRGDEVPLEVGVAEGRVWLGQIGHPDHAHREVMGDPVSVALALSDWVSDETVHALAWHVPASDLGVDFQERVTDLTLPGLPPLQAVGLRYGLP